MVVRAWPDSARQPNNQKRCDDGQPKPETLADLKRTVLHHFRVPHPLFPFGKRCVCGALILFPLLCPAATVSFTA